MILTTFVSVSCQGHLFFPAGSALWSGFGFLRLTMILAYMASFVLAGMCFSSEIVFFDGEFDPVSGRTLAACLTHASRAERLLRGYSSGERVSNT